MSIPLWDPIAIPPGHTMVDINGISPPELQLELQGEALQLWLDETGDPFEERDWSDEEGMFAVYEDASGDIVAVTIIVGVEDA